MVQLNEEPDKFVWNLTVLGIFTVKSMYEDLMNSHNHFPSKYLWKLKLPLKIKIFMWFLNRKVLLTKDNLIKRQWKDARNVVSVMQTNQCRISFSCMSFC
jgi:hypothetical protein